MNRLFYPRLAINNIKKNSKTYFPFLLACTGTIMMFYNMVFLLMAKDLGTISDSQSVNYILFLGTFVIAVFALIFLFYTNSFLIKRRKKEFGLFNMLGMEKRHLAKIMFFESMIISTVSIVVGILLGILFSKLMMLLLLKILSFNAAFGFEVPVLAVVATILLFVGIFAINFFYNVFQVYRAKPIELLKGGQVGEKEPKTKWILAIIGVLSLGVGYYIAVTTESPLAALNLFFLAVLLVIIGTYCLFTAGSIAFLKLLRRNKKYYYKANHFISVSGMIYRMKQNAAGLANICILSTMVIVMLSSTVTLYVGLEDVLRTRYPRNIIVEASNANEQQIAQIDAAIADITERAEVIQSNVVHYRYVDYVAVQDGANFTKMDQVSFTANGIVIGVFITLEDYNNLTGSNTILSNNEALLYTLKGDVPDETLNFNGMELAIKERLSSFEVLGSMTANLTNSYVIVVHDLQTIEQIFYALGIEDELEGPTYYYGFDVDLDKDGQISLISSLRRMKDDLGIRVQVEGPEQSRASFLALYGGLFFLGIFLGLLFIMATVLIIYYKQIAEGYDDRERFVIMQKVGLSQDEVKKVIRSQVLKVFFLPLVMAVIHIAFAFKVITKLLFVFNMTNVPLFALYTGLTILVFACLYAVVYALTAKTYYKIVRS